MNNKNSVPDAPVPPPGTEQPADQASRPQPAAESGALDTVSNVIEGVGDIADVIFSILE